MTKIIGITGASGSGKSTISNLISKKLKEQQFSVSQISQDSFYNPVGHPLTNYDTPAALELELLNEVLSQLKQGQTATIPTYDFVTHRRLEVEEHVYPANFVIVEGLFLLTDQLYTAFDLVAFLNVSQKLCFERRLQRDQIERGREPEDIKRQFLQQVHPGFKEHIEPYAHRATITVEPSSPDQMSQEILSLIAT